MGCWAIGGPWKWSNGNAMGWGEVDDDESIRAIHKALELGVNFFDTAANYGAGHSERILGRALVGRREGVVIATKFGHIVDEAAKVVGEEDAKIQANLRHDCENSLRRLNTETIDLYQLHAGDYPIEWAPGLMEGLEGLVSEGKIRWYGWSTDDPERAEVFAQGEHCASVQHRLNIFNRAEKMLEVCDAHDIDSINKSPLGSGLLTGKYSAETKINDSKQWRQRVDFSEERLANRVDP
jgi:aryl-alcohol dehydrogenase-like predicted oxidoreductase